jgi:hypothetical protein
MPSPRNTVVGICCWLWLSLSLSCRTRSVGDDGMKNVMDGPRVLVHVTDVHLSTHEQSLPFGSVASDLEQFVAGILNPISGDALLVTGDLVDAKDTNGAGLQYEEETLAWEAIEASVMATVLSVPGNHDRFDRGVTRGQARRASVKVLTRDGRVVEDAMGECPLAILLGIDASPRVGLRRYVSCMALDDLMTC